MGIGMGIGMRLGDCFSSPVEGFLSSKCVSSIVLVLSAAVLVLEMSDLRFRDGLQVGTPAVASQLGWVGGTGFLGLLRGYCMALLRNSIATG